MRAPTQRVEAPRSARSAARGASLAVAGIGRIYVWNGGNLWIGRNAGRGELHRHHAIQITLALDRSIGLRTVAGADWIETRGAIVRHEQLHQFDGNDASVAQIFVEPETAAGRALLTGLPSRYAGGRSPWGRPGGVSGLPSRGALGDSPSGRPGGLTGLPSRAALRDSPLGRPGGLMHQGASAITTLAASEVDALVQPLFARFATDKAEAPMIAAAQTAIARLVGAVPAQKGTDDRIVRVQEALRAQLDAAPTLAQTAKLAHLSPSRFRHLFVEQTGTSFRAYLLWLRMNAAVAGFNEGRTWTEAAHRAGFADSAHLSRTFRRMFGISPVTLVKE